MGLFLTGVHFWEEGEHRNEQPWVGECRIWFEERQNANEKEGGVEDVMPEKL